jgi:hypothetical protein
MTVAAAEADLWVALGEGKLMAVAKNTGENAVEIPTREWSYLKLYEENEQDVVKLHALDSPPTYKEITIARADLMRVWPAWPIEPYMIEPMTRAGTSGYVPLSSALLWVCTKAGTQGADLGDIELWEKSVADLLALIATGEIEVLGQSNSGRLPEKLQGHYFSKIKVSQPLSDYPFLFSDSPWISCSPFIDQEHWDSDFNDKMLIEQSGPATWTHLQVKKADVLREFALLVVPGDSLDRSSAKMPALHVEIVKIANRLWPNGKAPPRIKQRNAAIEAEFEKAAPNERTIRRALKNWP